MALPTASDNPFPSLLITEGSAPSSPASGKQRVFIDSADHLVKVKNSSGTVLPIPGQQMAYNEFTSAVNVTATVEASANTIVTASAVTFDGATRVEIEYFCPDNQAPAAADSYIVFCLFDGSTSLGFIGFLMNQGASGHVVRLPLRLSRFLTPSAAAHTYSVRAIVDSGTGVATPGAGGAGVRMPGYIRIKTA